MKKLVIGLLGFLALVAGSFLILRQSSGWNDGMEHPRSEIHAAVLNSDIYVAGGIGLFRVLDSCEKYSAKNKSWSRCAPLPRPLHHVAMAADNSRVYASGGYVALPFEQDKDAALFAYDPEVDQWKEMAKLPHPIGQHAMVHRDGKLYLIGGQNGSQDLASFWSYDIATGKWAKMPPMPTARHSYAIAMSEDRLYVTGGRSAALGTEINIVEMFDFAAGIWSKLPDMPTGRGGHGAYVRNENLHVFGGESLRENKVISSADILDLTAMSWSSGPPMTEPRHGFAVGDDPVLPKVYVIGGGAHPALRTVYSVTGTVQPAPGM